MAITSALEGSPFGRIPAELRLKIWEYALYKEDAIRVNLITEHENITKKYDCIKDASTLSQSPPRIDGLELNVYTPDPDTSHGYNKPSILSLSQTCKQIQGESMPVFLEMNSFHTICPIFDNSKGHGEINSDSTESHQQRLQSWLQTLDNPWQTRIKSLTIDLGLWRICGCKSSSQSFVSALTAFSALFPSQRHRTLKVLFAVQWRAICPCCESETDDESVWPLKFELERGRNDKFFEAVMETCEGRAKWILNREGLCGRTRMGWLVQLERASGRLVEVWRGLGSCGEDWEEGGGDDAEGVGEER